MKLRYKMGMSVLISIVFTVYGYAQISVHLSDTIANKGAIITVPVNVSQISAQDTVISYQLDVSFDSQVLTALDAQSQSTITPTSWNGYSNPNFGDGVLRMGAFDMSGQPLTGSGVLIFLQFEVIGEPGANTEINLSNVLFNAGAPPVTLQNGNFTVNYVEITIATSPANLEITFDGIAFFTPVIFKVTPDAVYSLDVPTPQYKNADQKFVWSNWSDGKAKLHNITAPDSGGSAAYTANFVPQYNLEAVVNPSASGTVTRQPDLAWYDENSEVTLTAIANSGLFFSGWSGDTTNTINPIVIKMNGPKQVIANFDTIPEVVIQTPNGSENWYIGSNSTILWQWKGNINYVNIEYSSDNGFTWTLIESGVSNIGNYDWNIPDQSSNQCLIRVSDAADGIPFDISDSPFIILQPVSFVQRVNCGGPSYVGADGRDWSADQEYSAGSWGYVIGNYYQTQDGIANTADDDLYRSEKYKMDAYRFTLPASGLYRVTLHFAEVYYNSSGIRVFDVSIENNIILDNLDLYAVTGHDRAWNQSFEVDISDGILDIGFDRVIGSPKISAIEVEASVPDLTPPVISGIQSSGMTTNIAVINWSTDEPTVGRLEYGLDVGYGNTTTFNTDYKTTFSQTLSGLVSDMTYYYRIRCRDASGNESLSGENSFRTLAVPAVPDFVQRVNCGGPAYVGTDGRDWSADQEYSAGSWGYVIGNYYQTQDGIANTADDDLYRSEKYKMDAYRFTLPASGLYRVTLHFAEVYYNSSGIRVFDVSIENNIILDNLDLYAVTGHDRAWNQSFEVDISDGILDIGFDRVVGSPKISAIEVESVVSDLTPPVISGIQASEITINSGVINWVTDELSIGQLDYGLDNSYGVTTAFSNVYATTFSQTLSGLLSDTTYYYRIRSRDAVGNESLSGENSFRTLKPVPTPPVISGIQASDVTINSGKITWGTDVLCVGHLEYGLTNSYGDTTAFTTVYATTFSQTLSGLLSDTTYYYRIHCRDEDGDESVSGENTFRTLKPDTTPPVISAILASGITINSGVVTWVTDESSVGQLDYGLTNSYGDTTAFTTVYATTFSQTLSGLLPDTTYYYRIRCIDAVGNESISGENTFRTLTPDTTPPAISGIQVSDTTTNSGKITWVTDESSVGQLDYGLTNSYGDTTAFITVYATTFSQTLSGLLSDTTYYYRIRCRDAVGNESLSGENSFRTLVVPVVPDFVQRVNCGGPAYVSVDGRQWAGDQEYSAGSWGYVAGNSYQTQHGIANTADDVLYRSEKYKMEAYRFTLPGSGLYRVTLHFAEVYYNSSGIRVFDVSIENNIILDNLDLYAVTGHDRAWNQSFEVDISDGILDISFARVIGSSKISAIEVVASVPDLIPPVISGIQSSSETSNSAVINWSTDESSVGRLEFGLDTGYGDTTAFSSFYATTFSPMLSGLLSDTTYYYRIRCRDASGNESLSGENSFRTLAITAVPDFVQRVNCGGPAYVGADGREWSGDQEYTAGNWGYVIGNYYQTQDAIANTADDDLYRSEKYKMDAYRFTLPGSGLYRVTLHFAEIYYTSSGIRVFDLLLENSLILDNLDVYAVIGHDRAWSQSYQVNVSDGILDIEFVRVIGSPKISAIEVESVTNRNNFSRELGDSLRVNTIEIQPNEFELAQNYPNPFNNSTSIHFSVSENLAIGDAFLNIYNINGKEVRRFIFYDISAGKFEIVWDGRDNNGSLLASGIYIYIIRLDREQIMKKMLYVK